MRTHRLSCYNDDKEIKRSTAEHRISRDKDWLYMSEILYSDKCTVCEGPIKGGSPFSRIKHKNIWAFLCCPLCAKTFMKNPDFYISRQQALEDPRTGL